MGEVEFSGVSYDPNGWAVNYKYTNYREKLLVSLLLEIIGRQLYFKVIPNYDQFEADQYPFIIKILNKSDYLSNEEKLNERTICEFKVYKDLDKMIFKRGPRFKAIETREEIQNLFDNELEKQLAGNRGIDSAIKFIYLRDAYVITTLFRRILSENLSIDSDPSGLEIGNEKFKIYVKYKDKLLSEREGHYKILKDGMHLDAFEILNSDLKSLSLEKIFETV